jgi:hypothetical protein
MAFVKEWLARSLPAMQDSSFEAGAADRPQKVLRAPPDGPFPCCEKGDRGGIRLLPFTLEDPELALLSTKPVAKPV